MPYAVWMVLMTVLGATAGSYAIRTLATALCLLLPLRAACVSRRFSSWRARDILTGLLAGVAVYLVWVAPEGFAWYRRWCVIGDVAQTGPSPYDPAVCGWPLTLVRLFGSAVVIAAAEELFFRSWLYRWLGGDAQAFWWVVALFALEHNRPLVGALAGIVYGVVACRRGLGAAIVAHATTNLILGLHVIGTRAWAFW